MAAAIVRHWEIYTWHIDLRNRYANFHKICFKMIVSATLFSEIKDKICYPIPLK